MRPFREVQRWRGFAKEASSESRLGSGMVRVAKVALEGLANGRVAILRVVPPSAGLLANRATGVELVMRTNLSQGMKVGIGHTWADSGNLKRFWCFHLHPDTDPAVFAMLQAKIGSLLARRQPRRDTALERARCQEVVALMSEWQAFQNELQRRQPDR